MLAQIKQFLAFPIIEDEEKRRTASLLYSVLQTLLVIVLALHVAYTALSLFSDLSISTQGLMIFGGAYLAFAILFGFIRRGHVQVGGIGLILAWLVLSVMVTNAFGTVSGPSVLIYVIAVVIGGLVFGGWAAISTAVLSIAILLVLGSAYGTFSEPTGVLVSDMPAYAGIFIMLALLLRLGAGNNRDALARLYRTRSQLQEAQALLESRVAARTRDLTLAIEVGRIVSQIRDLDILLTEAAELIRNHFDLYYTQIYLADNTRQHLRLRVGTGSVGVELVRRAHRLPITSGSINGRAALEKKAVVVPDTQKSSHFRPNPLLPDTRSEMAVPLLIGERVVGVLNMQSAQAEALTEENLPAFEALAGQLAIAIENAFWFTRSMEAQSEIEVQSRHLIKTDWQQFLNALDRPEAITYTYERETAPMGQPLLEAEALHQLATPILVSGEPVGVILLEEEGKRAWTEAETELMEAVAGQVAQRLETMRLLAQAENYRLEAETANRRLTRQAWEAYLAELERPMAGFMYDQVQVRSLEPAETVEPTFTQSLQVHDEAIGEIIIAGVEGVSQETSELIAAVSQQLSAHIENLRLAEQIERALATTRQRALELQEATTFLDSIVDNLPVMLFVKEADELRFVRWNKAGEALTGIPQAAVIGKNDYDFFPAEQANSFMTKDREVLSSGELVDIPEEPLQTEPHGLVYLHTRKIPIRGFDGKTRYLLGISEDITERKKTAEALAKRATELQTVAEVSAAASTILDTEQLLQSIVNLTKSRFDLYHVHIYLLNEGGDTLVLTAGSGAVGQQMVAQGHQIPLNREQSLVARAARSRQGVIVNDVTADAGFLPNPLLPDTRAEMAIPLIVGDNCIGVLDIQSDKVDQFSDEDLRIQLTLASQIAVAWQNARLYTQARRRAERERLVNTITQKIQSATTIEGALQTAVQELGQALKARHTQAELATLPETTSSQPNGTNGIAAHN